MCMQTKECCKNCSIKNSCNAEMTCADRRELVKDIVRASIIDKLIVKLQEDNARILINNQEVDIQNYLTLFKQPF